ncbi:MAG TPA: hypothetical protein VGJ94_06025 [Syntrophorhabdaceae bacterium]|jgi:hypothetical protein
MNKTLIPALYILAFLVAVPDLQAPEITERDLSGYEAYRIAENGAIIDRDGAMKGWFHGDTIYDTMWNEQYVVMEGKKLRPVSGGRGG